jgi:hypothetical protein
METIASARETPFGDVELRFPFNRDLVEALKEEIPARHRRWDAEDKRWLVTDPYTQTAIDLLIARFPNAETPATYARPPSVTVVREKPRHRVIALPSPDVAPVASPPLEEGTDQLLATITCPKCHTPHTLPIAVSAVTSAKAAKQTITPELIAVCPSCSALAVVAFHPLPAGASA